LKAESLPNLNKLIEKHLPLIQMHSLQ